MKTSTLVVAVVAAVVVGLAAFSFYHAHGILHVLHAQSEDHARAAMIGSRRPIVSGFTASSFPSLGAAMSSSQNEHSPDVVASSPSEAAFSPLSSSSANGIGNGYHSYCFSGDENVAGTAEKMEHQRQTYLLLNRHMVLGFVGTTTDLESHPSTPSSLTTLEFFPEVYNLQFTPPPPQPLKTTGGIGLGEKPSAPVATPFTSSAVAPELFSVVIKVAQDRDFLVQARKDADELRALKRAAAGLSDDYFPPDTDEEDTDDYVDGGVPDEPAFLALAMRMTSSKHCRAPSVEFAPVGSFEKGHVSATFHCHLSAILRPNALSGDGNGRALKLPGMARSEVPPDKAAAEEEYQQISAAWAKAPSCHYDISFDVNWSASLGPSDHFARMNVDLPARADILLGPVGIASNGPHCPGAEEVSAAYTNLFTLQIGTPLDDSLEPPTESKPSKRKLWHNIYTSGMSVEGTPLVDGTAGIFAALESPLSHNMPAPPTTLFGEYVDIYAGQHGAYRQDPGPRWAPWGFCSLPMLPNVLDRTDDDFKRRAAQRLQYGTVIGVYSDVHSLKRAFSQYFEAARSFYRRPLLHYNSWFDFFTWQEGDGLDEDIAYLSQFEPFNPLLKKLVERKAKVKDRKMNEESCKDRVVSLGTELHDKRGVQLDSFLWDDGWDNHSSLWDFHRGFPRGFTPVSEVAAKYGAGIGVWMSPWGGYGGAKLERIQAANNNAQHVRYETNAQGFSLVGKNYYHRFREIALKMVHTYKVNLFKFDGVAGHSATYAEEMQAMLALIRDLKKAGKDAFINLTTGTWASPFWLLFCDSIWRGMTDLGLIGDGTARQRWINYRDAVVYNNVVDRSPLFPITGLMLHGIVAGMVGESHARGLDVIPSVNDFAHEVFTYFGMGTSLQELYFSPEQVTPAAWDVTAHAARWARRRSRVLRDSHWIGGDPEDHSVYGFASASPLLGVMTLRNPASVPQPAHFSVNSVLQLDSVETDGFYNYPVIRTTSGTRGQKSSASALQWARWRGIAGTESPQVRVRCVHANPEGYSAEHELTVPPKQQNWKPIPGDCLRNRAVIKQVSRPGAVGSSGGAATASGGVVDQPLTCVSAAEEKSQAPSEGSSFGKTGYCTLPSWMVMLFLELAPHEAIVLEFEPEKVKGEDNIKQLQVFPVRPYDYKVSIEAAQQHRAHQEGHHDHPDTLDDDAEAVAGLPHAVADFSNLVAVPVSLALRVARVFEANFQSNGNAAFLSLKQGIEARGKSSNILNTPASLLVHLRVSRRSSSLFADRNDASNSEALGAPQFSWSAPDLGNLWQILCLAQHSTRGQLKLRVNAAFALVIDKKVSETMTSVGNDQVAWLQQDLGSLVAAAVSSSQVIDTSENGGSHKVVQQWLDAMLSAYINKLVMETRGTGNAADPLASLPVDLMWEVEVQMMN